MGAKLTANVLVLDGQGEPVLLTAGAEVPAEYADQVGDHCFEEQGSADEKPRPRARASK